MPFWHKPAVRTLGYIVFGFVALFMSFYLTFPTEVFGQRLAHEMMRMTDGNYAVSYDRVSLYTLSGVKLQGVQLRSAADNRDPRMFAHYRFDEVRARLNLLPLLWMSVVADARVKMGEGLISARVKPKGKTLGLGIVATDLDAADPPILQTLAGMPLTGRVSATLDATWDAENIAASIGDISLTISDASFGPGTIQNFTVPKINLGTLSTVLQIEAGQLQSKSFQQQGGDVKMDVSLQSGLGAKLSASSLDACVRIKPEQSFLEREEKMKTVAQLAEVQLQKDGQGFLNLPLRGTLEKPNPRFRSLCRPTPGK